MFLQASKLVSTKTKLVTRDNCLPLSEGHSESCAIQNPVLLFLGSFGFTSDVFLRFSVQVDFLEVVLKGVFCLFYRGFSGVSQGLREDILDVFKGFHLWIFIKKIDIRQIATRTREAKKTL